MSGLQRSVFRPKLGNIADALDDSRDSSADSHIADTVEVTDDDSSSASSASSVSSTGTIVPTPTQNLFARPRG